MADRRIRNETHLRVTWSERERDLMFCHPDHKWNAHFLYNTFCNQRNANGKTFVEELEARGFDIESLRFSIRKKEPTGT